MKRTLLALALVALICLTLASCTVEKEPETYCVTVAESEFFTVKGDATVSVSEGESVSFTLTIDSGYRVFSEDKDVTVDGNKVTVSNVTSDKTVALSTKQVYTVSANANNPNYGSVASTSVGVVDASTEVSITATPASGYRFVCWSIDKPLLSGAEIYSYENEISFSATESIRLIANFTAENKVVIVYDLNGGYMSITQNVKTFADEETVDFTNCVNLAGNLGNFEHDGYNFLEFNTKADGSGTPISAGGIMKMPENGIVTVYAQWQEWSDPDDFRVVDVDGGVAIDVYLEDDEILSIPAVINGKKVIQINNKAFIGNTFSTLVIPRTVVTIEDEAFISCSNFDTLYMNDNIESAGDASFKNCKRFSKLILNAAVRPHNVTGATVGTRLKVILSNEELDKPIIMLVAGSSTWYGYDSARLQELLEDKYFVLNCGTNADCCGFLYMEGLSAYLREGDIILNSPEYGHNQYAGFKITERTLLYSETAYNIYRNVDFSKYYGLFDALSAYNTDDPNDSDDLYRFGSSEKEYDIPNTSLTYPNCDNAKLREYPNETFASMANAVNAEVLTDERIDAFNWIYNYMKDKGIIYYLGCAPIYGEPAPSENNMTAYYNACVEKLECTIISDPNDHVYAKELYYDQQYHHTTEGARVRAERVAVDLKKILLNEEDT